MRVTCDQEWYNEDYFITGARWNSPTPVNYGKWRGTAVIVKAFYEVLGLGGRDRFLDVGCGRGYWVREACRLGLNAHGVDFSEWAIANPAEGVNPNRIHVANVADHLPFLSGSQDVVFCADVMEHIYEDEVQLALSEVFRVSARYVVMNIAARDRNVRASRRVYARGLDPETLTVDEKRHVLGGHVTNLPEAEWLERIEKVAPDFVSRKEAVWPGVVQKASERDPNFLENWVMVFIYERN